MRFVKTQVTEKGQWARELAVEVEAARIDDAVNKALRRYQKRLEIPGFRRGKVPLRIVEARFGSSIRGEVLGDLLPSLLEEATREAGLRPAAPPKISQLDHEPGGNLTFTADFDICPESAPEHYETLPATRMVHAVADEEIGENLEELRRRHATEQAVERPLANGDVLVADLQRLDDSGLPVIGDKYEKRHILIGDEDALSPEFEEALVGMSAGEERKIRFAYREDLPNEQLAGQTAHFAVAAHEVRERTLPELDDEFAKDLGEQFQTLDDLRQHLSEQIQQRWEYMAQQRLRSELINQLILKNDFELPDSMIDNYLDSLEREQADHDHDQDHRHSDEERTQATRQLKSYLLLESVRQQAGVEVTDEELAQFAAERAARAGVQPADLQNAEGLRRELEDQKVIELLIAKAEIKEEKV
ncbi:MAG: trigger factor [Gemmatimonadetes bacterium]|nr:trigger factor [Gemmatimonadota bacterium]